MTASLMQMCEGEGPSYFNPLEAATLVSLVVGLLQGRQGKSNAGVVATDVGIIATYRKQVPWHLCCLAK